MGSTSILQSGSGSAQSGQASGTFELIFSDFARSATGTAYFVGPADFPEELGVGGNSQNFVPVSGQSVQLLNNGANVAFTEAASVPEPTMLALLGLGLAGLGFSRRKQ